MPIATRQTIRKASFASLTSFMTLAACLPVTAAAPEAAYPGPDREIRLLVRPKASARFEAAGPSAQPGGLPLQSTANGPRNGSRNPAPNPVRYPRFAAPALDSLG